MDLWRTAAHEVGAEKGQAVARSGVDQLSAVVCDSFVKGNKTTAMLAFKCKDASAGYIITIREPSRNTEYLKVIG